MPIKEIIEQPLYYLKCPSTPLVLSHGELQLRLNRLSGKFLAISTFVESGDSYAAVIPTSSIIAALANDPRQFF